MIRFLRWLIWGDGHAHAWKVICEANVFSEFSGSMPEYRLLTLQCQVCGNVKRRKG